MRISVPMIVLSLSIHSVPRFGGVPQATRARREPGPRGYPGQAETGPRGYPGWTSPGPRYRAGRQAGSRSLRRWLTTADTPSPRIVTPYSASATSMVRRWWVTTMSWELSLSSSKMRSSRCRLVSSSAASTSSST